MAKKLILLFLFLGSTLGAYLPMIWGDSPFSLSSVFFSALGGGVGIYIGYTLGKNFD